MDLRHTTGSKAATYATFVVLSIVFVLAQPLELHVYDDSAVDPSIRVRLISTGNLHREIGLLLLGTFAILTLMRRRSIRLRPVTCLAWPIVLFFAWACASTIWSDDPALTARRLTGLFILAVGAVAVEGLLSFRGVVLLTFLTGVVTVVVGLFCEVALGKFHPFDAGYRFWGILDPNFTGWDCSLCLIAIVALARNKPRPVRHAYALVFVVIAGFLLLTKSRGALASALFGLLIYFLLSSPVRRALPVLFTSASLVCLAVMAGISQGVLQLLLLGRSADSATLTGRIPFWRYELLPKVLAHPIAGYGYGAFWTAARYEQQVSSRGWFFPDAHNSIIEIALGLGIIGLGLYITILAVGFYLSVRASRLSRLGAGAFSAAVLVCSVVNSMLSSIQFEPYLGSFVFFVVLAQIAYRTQPHRVSFDRRRATAMTRGQAREEQKQPSTNSALGAVAHGSGL